MSYMNNIMKDPYYVIIKICDKPYNCLMKYNLGNNENTSSIVRRKSVHLMKDSMVFTLAETGGQMCTRLTRIRYFSGNSEYIFGF